MRLNKKTKFWVLLSFLGPGVLFYTIFLVLQVVDAFRLSLFRWTTITSHYFIGLGNYAWLIKDPSFYNSLKLTLTYMVCITIGSIIIGFTFGYLVYLGLRGYNFFRVVYFIPTVLSGVAVSYIWKYLYSPSIGITRGVMKALGFGADVSPLGIASTAFASTIVVALWAGVGLQVMMFNSAFNNISEDVLEYASIDGCYGPKLVWYMIIPLSWDVVKMIIILQVIGAFRAFDLIFVMTGGGPYHSTEILPMYMYFTAFENFKFGEGNAIAVAIFLISLIFTGSLRKLLKTDSLS